MRIEYDPDNSGTKQKGSGVPQAFAANPIDFQIDRTQPADPH